MRVRLSPRAPKNVKKDGELNNHFFSEDDIQTFFESEHSKRLDDEENKAAVIEIEFEPEMTTQAQPVPPTPVTPVQNQTSSNNPNREQDHKPHSPIQNQLNIIPISTPSQAKPYIPPVPPPGALPRVENHYVSQYDYGRSSPFKVIAKFLGIFTGIFIISFIFLNFPALFRKTNYFVVTDIKNQSFASATPTPSADLSQSVLIIPQIQVKAPIIWNVDPDDITNKLEKGVVHYKGTGLPDEVGNTFITGHSSYYSWAQGDYKDVFALLDKLQIGEKIYIQYKGKNLVYQVIKTEVVTPDNVSALNTTNNKTLTLMTCVPVGTNLRRLIVTANQI